MKKFGYALTSFAIILVTIGCGGMTQDDPGDRQSTLQAVNTDNTCCPEGWGFWPAQGSDDPFDKNADGTICIKELDGGLGNSGQREGTETIHVAGHNHKDNNNPCPAP